MKTLRVKLVSALLLGLIAMPSDAVKGQQPRGRENIIPTPVSAKDFAVVFPPQVPGDRMARATVFLGANRRDIEVYVQYIQAKGSMVPGMEDKVCGIIPPVLQLQLSMG